MSIPAFLRFALLAAALWLPAVALGQQVPANGYQLSRYEPTVAGSDLLLLTQPWYAPQTRFSAALTLDGAYRPLRGELVDLLTQERRPRELVAGQFQAHLDLAVSPLRRLLLTLSMPLSIAEIRDTTMPGGLPAWNGNPLGEPRLGLLVRLTPDRFQSARIHLGGDVWLPLRGLGAGLDPLLSDSDFRARLQLVLEGRYRFSPGLQLTWATNLRGYYRPVADLPFPDTQTTPESRTGSEAQLAAAAYLVIGKGQGAIGVEAQWSTLICGQSFGSGSNAVELLLGGQYRPHKAVQIQAGLSGALGDLPGNAPLRGVLRVAFALPVLPTPPALPLVQPSLPTKQAADQPSSQPDGQSPPPPAGSPPPPAELLCGPEDLKPQPDGGFRIALAALLPGDSRPPSDTLKLDPKFLRDGPDRDRLRRCWRKLLASWLAGLGAPAFSPEWELIGHAPGGFEQHSGLAGRKQWLEAILEELRAELGPRIDEKSPGKNKLSEKVTVTLELYMNGLGEVILQRVAKKSPPPASPRPPAKTLQR